MVAAVCSLQLVVFLRNFQNYALCWFCVVSFVCPSRSCLLLDLKRVLHEIIGMSRENVLSTPKARVNGLIKNVYLWMTAGLALTGIVSYGVANNERLLASLYSSGVLFAVIIAQFVLVFVLSARLERMSTGAAVGSFIAYSVLNGIMLSSVFIAYTSVTVTRAFFTTDLMFAGMSLYAMFTKKDLSSWGSVLLMAIWGILIASLVNMFFRAESIYYLISIAGVVIFAGLTAWDTQKLMRINDSYGYDIDEASFVKLSIIGALSLYLDFINIFLYLLRIFGSSRSNRN